MALPDLRRGIAGSRILELLMLNRDLVFVVGCLFHRWRPEHPLGRRERYALGNRVHKPLLIARRPSRLLSGTLGVLAVPVDTARAKCRTPELTLFQTGGQTVGGQI